MALASLLKYDKRQQGSHGLALAHHPLLAALGLVAGMRVEPSAYLPDVGAFFTLTTFPCPVMFWNPREDTLLRHRNPLLFGELGLSPFHCAVDTLHCLYLGLFNAFVALVLWSLVDKGRFAQGRSQEEVIGNVLTVIRTRIHAWCKRRHQLNRLERMTGVHEFTKNMLGERGGGKVKTKGAEAGGVLLWLLSELESSPGAPDEARLAVAGRSLEGMVLVWANASWKLTPVEIQSSFDFVQSFRCVD